MKKEIKSCVVEQKSEISFTIRTFDLKAKLFAFFSFRFFRSFPQPQSLSLSSQSRLKSIQKMGKVESTLSNQLFSKSDKILYFNFSCAQIASAASGKFEVGRKLSLSAGEEEERKVESFEFQFLEPYFSVRWKIYPYHFNTPACWCWRVP